MPGLAPPTRGNRDFGWVLCPDGIPPPQPAVAEVSGMSQPSGVGGSSGASLATVEWNPVIDAAWWDREMAALAGKLSGEFPGSGPDSIDAAIALAVERVAVRARIPNYLPVLVGRQARTWLAERRTELENVDAMIHEPSGPR
jgi:hypothetical protein